MVTNPATIIITARSCKSESECMVRIPEQPDPEKKTEQAKSTSGGCAARRGRPKRELPSRGGMAILAHSELLPFHLPLQCELDLIEIARPSPGAAEKSSLQAALSKLIARHTSLRWT